MAAIVLSSGYVGWYVRGMQMEDVKHLVKHCELIGWSDKPILTNGMVTLSSVGWLCSNGRIVQ
jgi:hypothetical protein